MSAWEGSSLQEQMGELERQRKRADATGTSAVKRPLVTIHLMQVYEVITNSDGTEGRGYPVSLGFFRNHADAVIQAHGKGCMGSNAEIESSSALVVETVEGELFLVGARVCKDIDDLKKATREAVRKRALEKLTPEEREALGLKP